MNQLGLTADELKRAKAELLSGYETMYKDKDNRKNLSLTQEYIRNFTKDEIVPGIEKEYELTKQLLPSITLNDVNSTLKQLITDDNKNLIIAVTASTKAELPTETEILQELKSVKEMQFKATKEEKLPKHLVSKSPKSGKVQNEGFNVVSPTRNVAYGETYWRLNNGARVYFLPTNLKNDEILFYAYSEGGLSQIKTDDIASANAMIDIVEQSGVGEFSATQLSKMLAGRNAKLSFSIDDESEVIRGSSSVNDFETLLQLNYLYMTTQPRRDADAFQTLMDIYKTVIENRNMNPKDVFNDSIATTIFDNNHRNIIFNRDFVNNVNLDTALQLFHERFSGPQDYRFYFVGNIDPNNKKTRKLICKWIGSMDDTQINERYTKYLGAKELVQDTVRNYFQYPMKTRTASNYIAYSGRVDYTIQNNLRLAVLEDVLSTRYLESIREREGGSYGVRVSASMSRFPDTTAVIAIRYDTDPEKQDKLLSIINEEIQKIIAEGPLESDVAKAKEILINSFEQNVGKNEYLLSMMVSAHEKNFDFFLKDYFSFVNSISATDIQQFLASIVEQGNLVEVVMMPE